MLLTISKSVSSYNHGAFAGYTTYIRELNGWLSLKKENEIVMYGLSFPNYFLPSCLMLLLLPTFSTCFVFLNLPLFTPLLANVRFFYSTIIFTWKGSGNWYLYMGCSLQNAPTHTITKQKILEGKVNSK